MKKFTLVLVCVLLAFAGYSQSMMFSTNISGSVFKRDMTKLHDKIINVDQSTGTIYIKSDGALKALSTQAYYGFKDAATGLEYRKGLVKSDPNAFAAILQYREERQVYRLTKSEGNDIYVVSQGWDQVELDNLEALWNHIGKDQTLIDFAKANNLDFTNPENTEELLSASF